MNFNKISIPTKYKLLLSPQFTALKVIKHLYSVISRLGYPLKDSKFILQAECRVIATGWFLATRHPPPPPDPQGKRYMS